MKTVLFFAAALLSLNSYSQCSSINKDGIYIAKVDSSTNAYLKFFGKDSVITTTSDIPRHLSQKYISNDIKQYVLQGRYKKKGCFIKMKLVGMDGHAKMEGYMMGDNIGLSKVNLQNNTYTNLIFFYNEYETE